VPSYSFEELESEFISRVHTMVWCSAATIDTKDRPRSRILHPIWESGTGWVGSRPQSLKAKHLARNPHMSLAYIADVAKPVYADCIAEWENDLSVKQHVWDLFKSAPEPLGFDYGRVFKDAADPGFGVLKLSPWRIELFDISNPSGRKVWINKGLASAAK